MTNILKLNKSEESMVKCALAALNLYQQTLEMPDVSQEREKENEMPKKPAPQKLPAVTLDEVRQTAVSEADLKAKEIIYHLVGSDTYTSWFYRTGFIFYPNGGNPFFDANGTFCKAQIQQRFWSQCLTALKKNAEAVLTQH